MTNTFFRPLALPSIMTAIVLVAAVSAFGEGEGRRCAIITDQHAQGPMEIVADLLAGKLTESNLAIVDRAHLAQVLAEQTVTLAFSDSETAARRNICNIVGADLVVLVSGRAKEGKQLVEWSVASMPTGLRFASGRASWDEHHADQMLRAMLNSVLRADRLSQTENLQLVCVPPFLCRDATFDHSGRQNSLAKLTEELLLDTPNVAVVGLAEVDALLLETQLTGDKVVRRTPLTIAGAFETSRTDEGLRTALEIDLRAAGTSLGVQKIADLDDARIVPALSAALADLLKACADLQVQAGDGEEVAALTEQALAFIAVGELEDAIPLLKTAILLEPDNVETRMTLFQTWNAVSTDMVRLPGDNRLNDRIQALENTLDEFDEIARRRLVTQKDLSALNQTRGHGHLYGGNELKRTRPREVERYVAYCARYRDTLRRIFDGRYASDKEKTRDRALEMLIGQFGADRYDAPAQVHGEMLLQIRELVEQRGNEADVLSILLAAKPRAGCSEPEDIRFWTECCPPDNAVMAELASLAAALRGPREEADEEQFEKAFEHATKTLALSEESIRRVREIARPRLRTADTKTKQQAVSPLTVTPRLAKLAEMPNGKARVWLTEPDGMEFLATDDAVYRVTPQHTFELIRQIKAASLAWDTKYLWVANDEMVEVIEPNGRLMSRLEIGTTKYLTSIAAGKMFMARHDQNETGGQRAAHEIWTLSTGETPELAHELLYISDRNWAAGIKSKRSPSDLEWYALSYGYLLSDTVKGERSLFFNDQRLIFMDLDSYAFRMAERRWPQGGFCAHHAGAYYLVAGFSERDTRTRAIFRTDHPEREPQLIADLGCLRYEGGMPSFFYSGQITTAVHNDWLHVIFAHIDSPPQWLAVNLHTYDVRALATKISDLADRVNSMGAHLVASRHFGLLLLSMGSIYRIELPPEDTWQPYDEVVKDLRVPAAEVPKDVWARWRKSESGSPPASATKPSRP